MMYCFGRKGQFADLITTIVLVVFAAATVFFVAFGGVKIFDSLSANSDSGSIEKDIVDGQSSKLPSILQNVFLIIFLGMGIAVLVSAFLVRNYPLLSVIMLILMVFVVVYSPAMGNFYLNISENQATGVFSERMPYLSLLFNWYPRIILALSVVAVVIMFGKGGGEQ